jgi:hypothetical protein
MNSVSFLFIMLFGALFGFVFPYLLHELGLARKYAFSWISVFALVLLSFIGFMLYPVFIFGIWGMNDFKAFYDLSGGIFLGLSVALLIGGGANLAYHAYREKK